MMNEEMVLSVISDNSNAKGEIGQEKFLDIVSELEKEDIEEILHILADNGYSVVEEENESSVPSNYFGGLENLSNEELCVLYQKGNSEALTALYVKNQRLIFKYAIKTAKEFRGSKLEVQELVDEGAMGLMKAAERFDITLGFKFSTYATWWIRQAITREIMNSGYDVKIPVHVFERIIKVNKIRKSPDCHSVADIRDRLMREEGKDYSEEEIRNYLKYADKYLDSISLNSPVGEDDGDTELGDLLPGHHNTEREAMDNITGSVLRQVVDSLPKRERDILYKRYGLGDKEPMTLEQIAEEYNLTRERIRQIETKAIARLRRPCYAAKLEGLLAA